MRVQREQQTLDSIRRWARLLDSQFRVPGTNWRFGLDPLVGLVPGVGDFIGPVFGLVLIAHAWQAGVPKVVIARMLVNSVLDALVGVVPFLGDAFDLVWKANQKNLRLLERHAHQRVPAGRGDWIFVSAAVLVAIGIAALPVLAVIWIGRALF